MFDQPLVRVSTTVRYNQGNEIYGTTFCSSSFPSTNIFFLNLHEMKIPYQCALPWIAIICGIVAHVPTYIGKGLFPCQAFEDTFCKCDFHVSHCKLWHLGWRRTLVVSPVEQSLLSCMVSAILSSVDCRISVFLDVAAF